MIQDHEGFDIDIGNWPKRRQAMLDLLDNPRLPDYSKKVVRYLAFVLCDLLEANDHPICSYAIKLRLSGIRVRMVDGEVILIDDIKVEDEYNE